MTNEQLPLKDRASYMPYNSDSLIFQEHSLQGAEKEQRKKLISEDHCRNINIDCDNSSVSKENFPEIIPESCNFLE